MTDQPVLKTPGELLQEARQEAGLELGLMSERTKIPVAILRSLELDEYHKVSGPLYVNSFLRTYAADLGLDSELVLDAYRKFSGEVVATGPARDPEAVWVDEEVKISRVGLPWGMIGAVAGAILVLAVLVFWLVNLRGCSSSDVDSGAEAESSRARESLLVEIPSETPELSGETGPDEVVPDSNQDAQNDETPSSDLATVGPGSRDEQTTATVREVDPPSPILPEALSGNAGILFQDGRQWPVVLRLLCEDPVRALVVRDSDREVMEAQWLSAGAVYPVLPADGIQHGRPYQSRQGLVMYWGARDQFSLKLDSIRGVEVSLNGRIRDITDLLPGQELILFVPQSSRNNGF